MWEQAVLVQKQLLYGSFDYNNDVNTDDGRPVEKRIRNTARRDNYRIRLQYLRTVRPPFNFVYRNRAYSNVAYLRNQSDRLSGYELLGLGELFRHLVRHDLLTIAVRVRHGVGQHHVQHDAQRPDVVGFRVVRYTLSIKKNKRVTRVTKRSPNNIRSKRRRGRRRRQPPVNDPND